MVTLFSEEKKIEEICKSSGLRQLRAGGAVPYPLVLLENEHCDTVKDTIKNSKLIMPVLKQKLSCAFSFLKRIKIFLPIIEKEE